MNVHPHKEGAEQAADLIIKGKGERKLISDLIFNLTTHRAEGDAVDQVWKGILEHQEQMKEQLDRDPGLRVAALDYVGNVLKYPVATPVVHPDVLDRLYREAMATVGGHI